MNASLGTNRKIALDFLACDGLLIPCCAVQIKLTGSKKNMFSEKLLLMRSYNQNLQKLLVCSLFYRGRNLPTYHVRPCQFAAVFTKVNCQIQFFEVQRETFLILTGQNQLIRKNVFNAEPIRRMVLALCLHGHISGHWADTPLAFEKQ